MSEVLLNKRKPLDYQAKFHPRTKQLTTFSDIRHEMARVYRATLRGEMTTADMSRYISALDKVRVVIEAERNRDAGAAAMQITIRQLAIGEPPLALEQLPQELPQSKVIDE